MTREEILDGLYEIKNWKCNGDAKMHEVVTDAIEALEQEPCEDAISRQAVLRLVEQYPSIIGSRCVGLMADIKHLPPVTPQPKIEHWICTLEDWNKWECSECGFTKRTDVHVRIGYKYCPNCGAKMESEVSNADSD